MYFIWISIICGLFGFCHGKETYEGYKLIEVNIEDENQLNQLRLIEEQDAKVSFWKMPHILGDTADVAVPPDAADTFMQLLAYFGFTFSVTQNDLGSLITDEAQRMAKRTVVDGEFDLYTYHRHNEINDFLKSLVDRCNNNAGLSCKKIKIGRSYEGRKMLAIKIGKKTDREQPAIWIDAGIHAREWVAPATALWIMNKLIDSYDSSNRTRAVVDAFDWYILPSANPDGYEYSHEEDRLWRKTRKPNEGSSCIGTDPNRNWGYHWMETGASSNPCSDIYGGSEPFSEPETAAISEFLVSGTAKFEVYMSLHSYGQYWLTPWGYTDVTPDDYSELVAMGEAAAAAIRDVYGRHYTVGSSTLVLYAAAGGSFDWTKSVAGIAKSFAMELRDDGYYGFLLPEEQIKPAAKETFRGIRAAIEMLL